jgi:hypothetical protein
VTFAAVGAHTGCAKAERTLHARRGLTTFSIAASLVAAALIGLYFRPEVTASMTRYANLPDIPRIRTIGGQLVDQATEWLSRRPVDAHLRALAEADQGSVPEPAPVRQALATPSREARQSSENVPRQDALARELAEAQRAVDGLNVKLRTEAATAAQSLGQEREKMAALMQDADAARQALTEERSRSDALASELALARRDLDTKVALLSKADDGATQLKQAAEATTAELRQTLQGERERRAALVSELTTVRRDFETKVALSSKAGDEAAQLRKAAEAKTTELRQSLQLERQRAAALASELAGARSELDTKGALSNKADDQAAQFRLAVEAAAAELQQERDKSAALTSELATVHSDFERKVALSRTADDEAAQLKKAAEATVEELRQSLQQEHQKVAALARDLESARRVIEAPERTANSQTNQMKPVAEPVAAEQPAATQARGNPEAARLLARAGTLLAQGNIGAARIVLERAGEMGSAEATFALAETYDPLILSSWGTYGTRGDAAKAREFYEKARAGGIQEAKDRLSALRQ